MLLKLLRKHIQQGTLTVLVDGHAYTYGSGEPSATWVIRNSATLRKIARNPMVNLGETYIDQEWDVEDGKLIELLTILRTNIEAAITKSSTGLLVPLMGLLTSWNNLQSSVRNVSHHYDLEESIFRLFLDRDMHYSCAYFREPGMTIEAAQKAKCGHICKKLYLKPGQRVLDIGSGWGSLAMYLAENADVNVVGLTLSEKQLHAARTEADRRGLSSQVEFRLEDYRQHEGLYDSIVSVGMFEHVGRRNFQQFFKQLRSLLKPNGVSLIHTIGQHTPPSTTNSWIRRHIFPGGYIPAASETIRAIERSGLVMTDLEVWRQHYALTLREWHRRFQASRETIRHPKGERFCRIWEFYLGISATAFEVANLVVFHLQLSTRNDVVPLTRDYLHSEEVTEAVLPTTEHKLEGQS